MAAEQRTSTNLRSPILQSHPLRVAIVGMGGVTRQFRHWPERVIGRALARRGHSVVNIAYHDPNVPALAAVSDRIDDVDVYRVPVRHWPNDRLQLTLDATGPFDVMYLLHPRNVLAYGATRWAKRRNIPTVYTWLGPLHDRYVVDDRERPLDERPTYDRIVWDVPTLLQRIRRDGNVRDHLRNYWLHWPLQVADALLPCSRFEAEVMRTMRLIQPQTVVPLWLDFAAIEWTPTQPIELPRPSLLFVGQLTPRKGYDLLLRALPQVIERYPTATVQYVSGLNQEDRATLDHQARELGVANQIVLRGRVDDADLINVYRSADVYITPTRYEGFGLTLLEAMAAGCPLVATDIPVVNEIVQDSVNGLLARYNDPADLARAILAVLDDAALRQRLIDGGRMTIAQRFRENDLIERIENVFFDLIAKSANERG